MVRIVAVKTSYERTPLFVSPYFDDGEKKFFVGKDENGKPKAYDAKKVEDPRNSNLYMIVGAPLSCTNDLDYSFKHGDIFDPNVPKDAFQLAILEDSKQLAPSKREANPAPFPMGHRFYKDDAEADARDASTRADKVMRALQIVAGWTDTDMRDAAFVNNKNVLKMSAQQVEGFVKDLAMTRPERIIDLSSDRFFKEHAFLNKLVHYNLVKETHGQYRSGENIIGIDVVAAIHYLRDPKNSVLVKQFSEALKRQNETDPEMRIDKE